MKKILFLLLMASSIVASAQFKTKTDDIYSSTVKQETAGQYLIQASNSFIGSMVLASIGTAVVLTQTNPEDVKVLGSVLFVGSALCSIRGVILIGKSGKAMEKERKNSELSYNISPTGFGLRLTF